MLFRRFAQVMALAAAALTVTATAYAAKPSAYAPTLTTSLQSLAAASSASASSGTPYTISGCGYNASFGGVTIVVHTPQSTGWVWTMPDANGCLSVSNASTQGAGSYSIEAWQKLGKKDTMVASTDFSL